MHYAVETLAIICFHTRESSFLHAQELSWWYPYTAPKFQQEREEPGVPISNPSRTLRLFTLGDGAVHKRAASTCWRWEILVETKRPYCL